MYDAGPGVAEDFQDRLFTTFARAHPRRGEGTGLGLLIVKGMAEVNGGRAFYERHPSGGSCFGITLPAVALCMCTRDQGDLTPTNQEG